MKEKILSALASPQAFAAWLNTNPKVGGTCRTCPMAEFINSRIAPSVCTIFCSGLVGMFTPDAQWLQFELPEWARAFVFAFDGCYSDSYLQKAQMSLAATVTREMLREGDSA